MTQAIMNELMEIKTMMRLILEKSQTKEFYTPQEFADITHKNSDYVREICRKGRLNCKRTPSGRGNKPEIRIAHAELLRYQADGLLRQ